MSVILTDKEARFVAALLSMAADEFSNHGCNDLPEELEKIFTQEEWDSMNLKYHNYNGDPEEYQKGEILSYDWLWMNYFSALFNGDIE